jgi:uncharacterized protein (TIGR03067 family)
MKRLTLSVVALAALAAIAAPLPFPKPKDRSDLRALQGEWVAVRRVMAGNPNPLKGQTMTVLGNRMTFYVDGDMRTAWEITLDPKQSPRTMDRRRVGSKSADGQAVTLLTIYQIEGDTLTTSYVTAGPTAKRPTDFEGKKPGEWMTVYQRKK